VSLNKNPHHFTFCFFTFNHYIQKAQDKNTRVQRQPNTVHNSKLQQYKWYNEFTKGKCLAKLGLEFCAYSILEEIASSGKSELDL
jgi:hypothetical protein